MLNSSCKSEGCIKMDLVNVINSLLTLGIVIFAFLQWKCSNMQRNTELLKYRIKHILELKNFWKEFCKDKKYTSNGIVQYVIPKDYPSKYEIIVQFLDEHLAFTQCYFNTDLYTLEKSFISLIENILPVKYVDTTIFDIKEEEFNKIQEMYKNLNNEMLKRSC